MTNLKFFKVYIMMLLGMSVSSIFGAFDFTTNYNNSDALYWQGKSSGSLDASKKAVLQTNVVDLINNRGTLEPWQLSYAQDLVSRLANASFFSATEKADYTNQLATLSAPPPPSYKSVATRLTELQGRINKISGTLAQTDISVITTELQNLLPELYGSERDRGTFIMTIRSLKSKATFARVSTTGLDQMEANLKTITNSNRITFLERAVSDENFKDQTERDLFVSVAKMLRELMDKLSNDEITRFHTSIVSSLNSPNFTEEDKKYLWALGSEVVDYFNSERLGGDSSGSTIAPGGDDQESFANIFAKLQALFKTIDTNYKQGNQTDALNAKSNEFYPLVNSLSEYLGDMMVAEYLNLPALVYSTSPGSSVSLPALSSATDPSGAKNDQQAVQDFFTLVLASKVFSLDQKKIDTLRKIFINPVTSEVRLKYLEDSNANKILSEENKKRFLWHLRFLVESIGSTDKNRALSFDQQSRLTNLLNVISQSDDFSAYNNSTKPVLAAIKSSLSAKLLGAASQLTQNLIGRKIIITPYGSTKRFLGVYNYSNANVTDYKMEAHESYALEPQNVFQVIAGAAPGEIIITYDAGQLGILYLSMNVTDGVAKFYVLPNPPAPTAPNFNDYSFIFAGSSLDNVTLKSKAVANSFLAFFETGVVSAINPVTGIPLTTDSVNQHFKIQTLTDFEASLVAARKAKTATDVINSYVNLIGQAIDVTQKISLVNDLSFYLTNLIKTGNFTLDLSQVANDLVNQLNSRNDFLPAAQGITALKDLLQKTIPATVAQAKVVDATSDPAVYLLFQEGAKVALQFGKPDSPSVRYLVAVQIGNDYFLKALKTTPADPAAQFIISKRNYKITLESVKFSKFLVAYDESKLGANQDLNLVSKTDASFAQKAEFATVKSAIDPSSICLINGFSKGFVSVMSEGSVMTTDLTQGWSEQDSSRLSLVSIDANVTNLSNISKDTSLTYSAKLNKYLDLMNKVTSVDLAFMVLRETYGWLLSIKKNNDSWQKFLSSADFSNLFNKVKAIPAISVKKYYTSSADILNAIKSLLAYNNPDASITLYPSEKELFWLVEPAFAAKSAVKTGYTFAVKTSSVLRIVIDTDVATYAKTGEKYQIAIGEISPEGNRQIVIYKAKEAVARADFLDFNSQDYTQYQLVFDRGSFGIFGTSGLIVMYDDSASPLINVSNDPSANLTIGLTCDDAVVIDKVQLSLDLQIMDFFTKFEQDMPAAKISRVINVLSAATSIDVNNPNEATMKALLDAADIANNRLMYNSQAITMLSSTVAALKTKRFVFNNYSANSRVDALINQLKQVPAKDAVVSFVYDLIDKLSFYNASPIRNEDTANALKNIVIDNLSSLINVSYEEADKNIVRAILNDKLSKEQLLDANMIYQYLNMLNNQVRIELTTGAPLVQQLQQLQGFLSNIQTISQRDTVVNYIQNLINQIKNLNSVDRTNMNKNITDFSLFIDNLYSNIVFKDILGSLDYFKFMMNNAFFTPADYVSSFVAALNQGVKTEVEVMDAIKSLSTTVLSWFAKGMHSIHDQAIQALIDSISAVRQNPKISARPDFINSIDVLTSTLRTKGDLSKVIADIRAAIPSLRTTTDRQNFFVQLENSVVKYIENQIAAGSVKEADRSLANNFVIELQNNSSFKDATSMARLTDFSRRVNASVDPSVRIAEIVSRPKTMSVDKSTTDQFIADLSTLSNDLKSFIASGGTIDSTKIATFNDFIESLKAQSATENSAYRWLYIKRNWDNPKLNLDDIKLGSLEAYDLISRATALYSRLQTDNLLSYDVANKFLSDYDKFVYDWRIAVIFDRTKADLTNPTFKPFYQKMADFFSVAAKTVALGSRWDASLENSFEMARQDMLENKFDAIDKTKALKLFLQNPGIGGKTVDQLLSAVTGIVNDFKYYRSLIFTSNDNVAMIIDLLDNYCIKKAEMSSVVTQLNTLKASLAQLPSLADRVRVVNLELVATINSAVLSEAQKSNLISVCSSLITLINQSNKTALGGVDIAGLKTNLQQLSNRAIFNTQDQNSLNSFVATLNNLGTSTVVQIPTQVTTPVSVTLPNSTQITNPVVTQSQQPVSSSQPVSTVISNPLVGQAPIAAAPVNSAGIYTGPSLTGNFGNFNNNPNYEQAAQRPNVAFRKVNYR